VDLAGAARPIDLEVLGLEEAGVRRLGLVLRVAGIAGFEPRERLRDEPSREVWLNPSSADSRSLSPATGIVPCA
jgi:hypothetical protein